MKKLVIIGTSDIVEEHIKCLIELKFQILVICSTRKKSKNLHYLTKKYNIKNSFDNFKTCEKFLKINKDDFAFFLAPRIKDTESILLKCLKYKKKIFIEKPLTNNLKFIDKIKKYENLIFVGYNRIFYQNVILLKKRLNKKKNLFVEVSCPENNKKKIQTNSCHIISILIFWFNRIKIINIKRNFSYILVIAKIRSKGLISIRFNFNSSENFCIKVIENRQIYVLKPIEILNIFNKMHVSKQKKLFVYNPVNSQTINEYKINNFKPGFYKQAKEFKQFLKKRNKFILNNITYAKKVIEICNKIYKNSRHSQTFQK